MMKGFTWRSAAWWHALHTRMMKEDPENSTRWKHKWSWHNRGNLWDMMAARLAREKDWTMKRIEHPWPSDQYKFITYILNKMKLPTEHRKREKKMETRSSRKRHSEIWVEGTTRFTRVKTDLQCNCVETVMWLATGSRENFAEEQSARIPLDKIRESCTHGGRNVPPTNFLHGQLRDAHLTGNIIKKQTTGPTLEHKEEDKLISTWKTLPQHGKRYEASGMEASKGIVIKGVDRKLGETSKIAVSWSACSRVFSI